MEEKEMKEAMNASTLLDYIIEHKNTRDVLEGLELSDNARKMLVIMLNDWVFGNIPWGEEASMEAHAHAVLIVKSFIAGYKIRSGEQR